jgi:hypothetical protein
MATPTINRPVTPTKESLTKSLNDAQEMLNAKTGKTTTPTPVVPTAPKTTPPTTPTPTTPTVPTYTPPKQTYTPEETKARAILYDTDPFDEITARKNALRAASSQIKAVEDVYADKIANERKLGERDMARSNTISAMTGMTGGVDATTRAGNSDRRTEERVKIVENQMALALSAIYDKVDANVLKEKEMSLQTQRDNAQNVLDEIATNAKNALNSFASEGVSWEALKKSDPDTISNLVRQSGQDAFTVQKLYEDALPPDKKPATLFEGFKGDNFITIKRQADGTISTDVHDAKEIGIPDTFKDPASVTVGDTVYWYDTQNPLNADGTPKLIKVGAKPSTSKKTSSEDATYDEAMSFDEWKTTPEANKLINEDIRSQTKADGTGGHTTATAETFLRSKYNDMIRENKVKGADRKKNYTAVNIPNAVKSDLIHDITVNKAPLDQLYGLYPDVSSAFISATYNSLQPKKKKEDEEALDPEMVKLLESITGSTK